MNDLQQNLARLLRQAVDTLATTGLAREAVGQLEPLVNQVDEPCIVAVVGRVKAGKSSFINAFLEDDLAQVGTVETTATINYFRYGVPPTPERPIRCYWRNGQYTYEDRRFLDSLQGNDIETLRRSEGIDHLEYYLPNPRLKEVTLVDTPGINTVVDEHQARTDEFMALRQSLRKRHNEATQRLGSQADAVIYLTGEVAQVTDRDFLEEFRAVTQGQSRPFNAIGVMAKIDLYDEVMERRARLAQTIGNQLKESLNIVVPVSAGIQRALQLLQQHDERGLERLIAVLRKIPPARLEKLLSNEELFRRQWEDAAVPVTLAERTELLGNMQWRVFVTIARVAADPALNRAAVVARLNEISGFGPLADVLERHFFKRGHVLRCYRIVDNARRVLGTIRFQYLPEYRERDRDDQAKLKQLLAFIQQARGHPALAAELEKIVRERLAGRADRLEAVVSELEPAFDALFHELEEYNADWEALQQLEDCRSFFSKAERDELQALLGLYGLDVNQRLRPGWRSVERLEERQQAWMQISMLDARACRRDVAQRAVMRYGLILEATNGGRGEGSSAISDERVY